ncbi:hypothetical protein [Actinomycetospora termitidis]|uniref:Uncharacterized protein n=1 Tax=Actinomycetospora termitidis TaxID=3053470 RepID=A0ABT7M4V3_9PSEU|nr:hypothetical protein [Actinomycetospora sp. Odt1-22]MDL5155709.1 hypothetical protein [Actinomycetospora sp. Odt1-22]
MSSGRARIPVPGGVIGVVIALCAVLLLKWLAIVALVVCGLTLLARWAWRRHRGSVAGIAPATTSADAGLDLVLPAPRPHAADDCTWCGLVGGHRDLRGRPVRPRHAHAA